MLSSTDFMERREEASRMKRPRARAGAILIIYALAAILGLFHGWHEPTASHVCGASSSDLERSDGTPAHDESRCALCHVLQNGKWVAPATRPAAIPGDAPCGVVARPARQAVVSATPRTQRSRGPPAA
jgi:hypothetical protein